MLLGRGYRFLVKLVRGDGPLWNFVRDFFLSRDIELNNWKYVYIEEFAVNMTLNSI